MKFGQNFLRFGFASHGVIPMGTPLQATIYTTTQGHGPPPKLSFHWKLPRQKIPVPVSVLRHPTFVFWHTECSGEVLNHTLPMHARLRLVFRSKFVQYKLYHLNPKS
jgi:hypothetical protein